MSAVDIRKPAIAATAVQPFLRIVVLPLIRVSVLIEAGEPVFGTRRPVNQLGRTSASSRKLGRSEPIDALGGRVRRGHGDHAAVELPTDEHGVVFMHGVVAVLHEHPRKLAELHGESHAAAWTKAIHVLPAALPWRYVVDASVAGQDLSLFEVDVDGVIPTAATVLESPDFAAAPFRSGSNPAVV